MKLKKLRSKLGYHLIWVAGKISSIILVTPLLNNMFILAKDSNRTPKKLRKIIDWSTRKAVISRPSLKEKFRTGKALVIYHSNTGNTEKVAMAIERGLKIGGLEPTIKKVTDAFEENYYDYDLVCFGTPCFHALPPPPVMKLLHENFARYRKSPSEVSVPAKPISGKYALVFATFSGPHVGVAEAYPAGKLLAQEFEHLGFEVKGEWYIVAEFHGWKEGSTKGKLGDIRGRPNKEDLDIIEYKTIGLAKDLNNRANLNRIWVRQ
jgi:hypothetical protein